MSATQQPPGRPQNAPGDISLFPTCRHCNAFLGTLTTTLEKARKVVALLFCDEQCRDAWTKKKAEA